MFTVSRIEFFILRYIDRLWIRHLEILKEKALNCVGQKTQEP